MSSRLKKKEKKEKKGLTFRGALDAATLQSVYRWARQTSPTLSSVVTHAVAPGSVGPVSIPSFSVVGLKNVWSRSRSISGSASAASSDKRKRRMLPQRRGKKKCVGCLLSALCLPIGPVRVSYEIYWLCVDCGRMFRKGFDELVHGPLKPASVCMEFTDSHMQHGRCLRCRNLWEIAERKEKRESKNRRRDEKKRGKEKKPGR